MISSNRSGGVITSVRIYPFKLLGVAMTLGLAGILSIRETGQMPGFSSVIYVWAGLALTGIALYLGLKACRQISRAVRAFFS